MMNLFLLRAGRFRAALLLLWLVGAPVLAQPSTDSAAVDLTGLRRAMKANHAVGVSAHRGTSHRAPENTLATFRTVLGWQVDYLEIDVRTTRDGQLVILHDGSLDRTTTGSGPAKEKTLAELRALSAGKGFGDRFTAERIPTLDEVCQLVADWNQRHPVRTNLYVDCKDVAPEPLVAVLAQYGLLREAVFYGSDAFLLALRQVAPDTRRMPSLKAESEIGEKVEKLAPYAFDVRWSSLSPDLIRQVHQRGIRVFSDALGPFDQPDQYRKAAGMGIDVIQTDYVVRVYQTLAAGQ